MHQGNIVPVPEYDKITDEKNVDMTSTRYLLLCEEHFAAAQYMNPNDKGWLLLCIE